MHRIPKVILLLETSRQYGRQLLRGVARYARLHGPWALVVSPGHLERELPRAPRDWGGDAIIARTSSPKMVRAIRKSRIPAVLLEATDQHEASLNASLGISEIRPDTVAIARAAADHLIERGFQHFAYCGLADALWSAARQRAFYDYLSRRHVACTAFSIASPRGKPNWDRDRAALVRWLRDLPKPVGLMAANDDLAAKALDACLLADLRVPDEVAVVGVDNDELVCELSDPPLSSVDLDLELAGYDAAALLHAFMTRRARGYHTVQVKPRWVVSRRSTDVIAQDDRLVAAALRFIHDHAVNPIGVPDVVAHVGLSRRSLERRFTAALGRTILEELTRRRLDRAKRLLLETDLSIERVAASAGFSATKRLVHAFRKLEAKLPHAYRVEQR